MPELSTMSELLVESLGWSLLHFLWQGALVAALFALLRLCLSKASPRIRMWLGYTALLTMALAPAWTFVRYMDAGLAAAAASAAPAGMPLASGLLAAGAAAAPAPLLPLLIEAALPWLVGAWLLGVLVLSLRGVRQWRALRCLCTVSLPAEPEWQRRLEALCRRMGVRQAVQLRECALVAAPMLVGWLRPVILLPVALAARLPAAQVEMLLAHELAHVRRLDYLANLLQMALETALFYHPAVHWISRCVREDREQCCDDLVTAAGADRLDYARALLSLAEQHVDAQRSLAMAANGGALLERIERIVEEPRNAPPAAASTPLLVLAGAVLLAALGLKAMAPGDRDATQPAVLPALGLGGAELVLPAVQLAIADLAQAPVLQLAPARLATGSAAADAAPVALPAARLPATVVPEAPAAMLQAPTLAADALQPLAASVPALQAPAPTAAPAAAEATATGPVPLSVREPAYPRKARLAGIEGWVRMSYLVDPAGRPYDLRIEDAYPNRVFVASARDALARWQFAPGDFGGTRYLQTFDFVLAGKQGADGIHCDVATGSHLCRRRD